jgi:uncharacterized protein (TIGR02453 family)
MAAANGVQFAGFPPEALTFFDELEDNNNRTWFHENKHRYEAFVRVPMEQFLASVAAEFGEAKVFRPNRDTRFGHDKSPYKTNIGAVITKAATANAANGAAIGYVHLDRAGLFAAAGYYMMATDQIARYRAAVIEEKSGTKLAELLAVAAKQKVVLGAPQLKRVPPAFDKEHMRAELLKYKSVTVHRQFGQPSWLGTSRAGKEVAAVWRAAAPLVAWLDAHVGPSDLPLDRR